MKRSLCVLFALLGISALAQGQKPAINANGVQDSASNTVNVAQGGVFSSRDPIFAHRGSNMALSPIPPRSRG